MTSRAISARRGLNFLEIMLAIGIFSIVAASAFGLTGRFLEASTLQSLEQNILDTLRRAQDRSVKGERSSAWGVRFLTGSYVLYAGNAYALRTTALDEPAAVSSAYAFSGLPEVTFRKLSGRPFTGGTVTIRHTGGSATSIFIGSEGTISRK